ncbi:MAG: hypothetical protein ACUVRA_04155 [Candidatus Bathyarchaeaceae archaeon]
METKKTKKIYAIVAVILCAVFTSLILSHFLWRSTTTQFKVVIIDQVMLTYPPSEGFLESVNALRSYGFQIDYFIGEEITVEFYRNLPSRGYSLIIMRTHSRPTGICTGEPYEKTKYVFEQSTAELIQIFLVNESYFGITASFIRNMRGNFRNATILCMGCDSLSDTVMAEAFIGWKQSVLVSYTDQATTRLLIHLILERKTINQAVTETMTEMGPYPILDYYPHEAGEMKVIANG